MLRNNCAAGVCLLSAQFAFAAPPATHIYASEAAEFAGIRRGQRIADFLPKSRDFVTSVCGTVGDGRVYVIALDPDRAEFEGCANVVVEVLRSRKFPGPELHSDSDDPGWVYPYFVQRLPVESFIASEPLDAIWMWDRFHDLRSKELGKPNLTWVLASLFNALKQGGELNVEEPRVETMRIKEVMLAVGFEFVTECGRGERVMLKFRKPY